MKLSILGAAGLLAVVNTHGIFQKLSVNGTEQDSLAGLRAPPSNDPVYDPTSSSIICGAPGTRSRAVVPAHPGDRIGVWFQHFIGGPHAPQQGPNHTSYPVAPSHKGPVIAYLAKVDDAAMSSHHGLKWFKIWQDTFDPSSKRWGIDNLISNKGWAYFILPRCLEPGHYLVRVEIIALHSAYTQGQAQFYSSCGQLSVGGSGMPRPWPTVGFPGAYSATDPGIKTNIYGSNGQPDNGGRPYPPPGPPMVMC